MAVRYQYGGLSNTRRTGLSVSECTRRLRRLACFEEQLMFLQAAHIISSPQRDVKALLARLQYEDADHATRIRARLTELRVAQLNLRQSPDTAMSICFAEAIRSQSSVELIAALARVLKPALLAAYREYLAETNTLADYATVRLLDTVVREEQEALELLQAADGDLADTREERSAAETLCAALAASLKAAGGVLGADEHDREGQIENDAEPSEPPRGAYEIPRQLTRDDAFPRVWDIEHVTNDRVPERLAQMIATRLGEVTIAEALGCLLYETQGQPWSFYADISRHLWDEMRHSLFGEAAAEEALGERSAMPLRDWESAYLFDMPPLELYAMLAGVESGLMKYPPGKREEFEFCRDKARHPLMATFQDFDWADEVLHVQISRRQLKDWFPGTADELRALGERGLGLRAEARSRQPPSPLPDLSHTVELGND